MKTRPLQRHPIARADEVGTFHIMDCGGNSPECGHGLAKGEKKKFNRANRETVTCGRCKRTLLYKDHTDEFKRLDWIANREKAERGTDSWACGAWSGVDYVIKNGFSQLGVK